MWGSSFGQKPGLSNENVWISIPELLLLVMVLKTDFFLLLIFKITKKIELPPS